MSQANDRQVGGAHYKKDYQHWDFVCDSGLHYLLGCASKYVSRWKEKNGLEDLEKSLHYLQKAQEAKVLPYPGNFEVPRVIEAAQRFVGQLPEHEAEAVMSMVMGDYFSARAHVELLIADRVAVQAEAAKNMTPLFKNDPGD